MGKVHVPDSIIMDIMNAQLFIHAGIIIWRSVEESNAAFFITKSCHISIVSAGEAERNGVTVAIRSE
jgi:hypothetical protein